MLLALSVLTLAAPVDHPVSRDGSIDAHLADVEADLRAADVRHLSDAQLARRLALLDVLRDYRLAGVFPHNHEGVDRARPVAVPGAFPERGRRAPVFVDSHATHCAVGYLLAVDGRDELVAAIVAGGNLRYIHEIDDPALAAWASTSGVSVEELARIQPTYGEDTGDGGPVDLDGDGFDVSEDCDDGERKTNPGADEICGDGVDNDCDDHVDETECNAAQCSAVGASPGGWLALLGLSAGLWRRRSA